MTGVAVLARCMPMALTVGTGKQRLPYAFALFVNLRPGTHVVL